MKKVEIIKDGCRYLHGFEPNETYIAQKRAIQTGLHNASEYNSIWSSDPKAYDIRTGEGYLNTLLEEMRWGKFDEKRIELRIFEEGTGGEVL